MGLMFRKKDSQRNLFESRNLVPPSKQRAPAGELGRELSRARLGADRRRTVRALVLRRQRSSQPAGGDGSLGVLLLKEMFALTGGCISRLCKPGDHWVSRACACLLKTASRVPLYLAAT